MDWGGWARPYGHSAASLVLGQHARAHASVESEHPFWNLDRKYTPPPASPPLSPGVMGDEDVSCHSTQDRELVNPGFIISGVAGDWTSAPQREQAARTGPLASPHLGCKQANLSPSCFIYTWCLLPLTWILTLRVGGISRKTTFVVCHWFPVSPPLSLSFSRLQELLNGTSWTPNAQLKIPEHVLIYIGASSPGALQTLSHLSLKIPREVGCGQRILLQKGKGGFERKGHRLRFYSEAWSLTPPLKTPITAHSPFGAVRIHIKPTQTRESWPIGRGQV